MKFTKSICSGIALSSITVITAADGPPSSQWVQTWDPGDGLHSTAGLVEVTEDGFTYVATLGSDGPDGDIVLLKYDQVGNLVWEQSYNGPGNDGDSATDIELTSQGVSVVGSSPGIGGPETVLLDYDSSGNLVGEFRTFGPQFAGFLRPQLAIGSDGRRVVATDDNNGLGSLEAYSAQGDLLFSETFTFEGFSGVSSLEVADDLSTFMTTVQIVQGGGSGYVVRKFDPVGQMLWSYEAAAETGLVLGDAFMVPQADGGVIVAGSPETFCFAPVTRVWRLDPKGNQVWTKDLPNGCDFSVTIGMVGGDDGAVYIAGSSLDSTVYRLEPDGTTAWANPVVSTKGFTTRFTGIAFSDGRVVLGASNSNPGFSELDMRILCYDTKGLLQWSEVYTSPDGDDSLFGDVATAGAYSAMVGTKRTDEFNFQNTLVLGYGFDPVCVGDVNQDGTVDVVDLFELLSAWGRNPGHVADLNDDGVVDAVDLLALLSAWGGCV